MNVTVMSRRNAVLYCGQKNPDKSVMISISDPRMVYDSEPYLDSDLKKDGFGSRQHLE